MTLDLATLPTGAVIAIGVLAVAQLALQICALVILARTPNPRMVFGRKWPWVLIIVLTGVIGPVVFFAAGRRPAETDRPTLTGTVTATDAATTLYGDRQ